MKNSNNMPTLKERDTKHKAVILQDKIKTRTALVEQLIEIENAAEGDKKYATIKVLGTDKITNQTPILPLHIVTMIREEMTRIVEALNYEFSQL